MSHYAVNASVPKTLVRHLIDWVARTGQFEREVVQTLRDILATRISPELIPLAAGGEGAQGAESVDWHGP